MGDFNIQAFESFMNIVKDPDVYDKKLKKLDSTKKNAEKATARMQAAEGALKVKQEEVEAALVSNHKVKAEANKLVDAQALLKKENKSLLVTLNQKKSEAEKKLGELKNQEAVITKKLKDLEAAKKRLEDGKVEIAKRLKKVEIKEQRLLEIVKAIS